jgi:hypothetical protein
VTTINTPNHILHFSNVSKLLYNATQPLHTKL